MVDRSMHTDLGILINFPSLTFICKFILIFLISVQTCGTLTFLWISFVLSLINELKSLTHVHFISYENHDFNILLENYLLTFFIQENIFYSRKKFRFWKLETANNLLLNQRNWKVWYSHECEITIFTIYINVPVFITFSVIITICTEEPY